MFAYYQNKKISRQWFHPTLWGLLLLMVVSGDLLAANVNLAWDASTAANVAGYIVYYGQNSGIYTASVDVGNSTSYTFAGLQDGTAYYFAVSAYDTTRVFQSRYSNETAVNAAVPPTVNFTASQASGIAPLAVTFTPVTTGPVTSWQWSFGDGTVNAGTSGTVPTAVMSYGSAGVYTVTLTVAGPGGTVTQTQSNLITVTAPPSSSTNTISPVSITSPASTTSTTSTASTISTTSSATGLVAAYGFDETSGGTAVPDYSGLRNNGTLSNVTRVANGRFGNALQFNGTNSMVTVNNNASLALSTGMTLEAWVYPTVWMSGAQTVIMKEGVTAEAYLLDANNSTNQPMSAVWTGGEVAVGGNGQIPPNQWSHLATTYDGQYQSLYVNGVLVNVMPQTGVPATSTGALRIGGNSLWGNFFQGYIDEVRIYNRALTNAQIISDSTTPVSVSNPPSFDFGNQNVESTVQSLPAGVAMAFQFTAPQNTQMATNIQVYLDPSSTATRLEVGVYTTGTTGHPSSMPTGGWATSSLKAGWNTIPVSAQSFSAGQTYWIAIIGVGGTVQLRGQPGVTTNAVETSASSTLAGLPYTWVTGSVSTGGPISAYVSGY